MFFIDVQGTLLSDLDKSLINGAAELIDYLNLKKTPYVIVTNNTKKLDFLDDLRKKGLNIKENAYLDPFCVLKHIIKPCEVAAYGSNEFLNALESLNFTLDYKAPKAVLIASYDEFKFSDFAKMIEFANENVKMIAMHETSIYKKNNLSYPGVGSIMAMLKNAVSFEYSVVGKPSFEFYEAGLNLMKTQDKNADFSKIHIISDDFKGDLVMAHKMSMKASLVLSGKISSTKNIDAQILNAVYKDVGEFLEKLRRDDE